MQILNAIWENVEHTVMTVWFTNEQYINLPYGINLSAPDESPIYKEIIEKYEHGEFVPDPYVSPTIDLDVIARDVRRERDKRLSETDYLLMTDYPISNVDRNAVKAYRQSLRDITTQDGFPKDVVWPEKPEVVK